MLGGANHTAGNGAYGRQVMAAMVGGGVKRTVNGKPAEQRQGEECRATTGSVIRTSSSTVVQIKNI